MKITQSYITKNPRYQRYRKFAVTGLMLHSIGVPQPKAAPIAEYWDRAGSNAEAHGVIQPDGMVLQALPWDCYCWHCGGVANSTHVGVEMTEPDTIRYTSGANWIDRDSDKTRAHVEATYATAVDLFAFLCLAYKLNPLNSGVVLSHSEGHKRGVASGHADVEHLWNAFGLTMNQFRLDVKTKMEESDVKTENITVMLNEVSTTVSAILHDGHYYIQARELAEAQADDKLTIAWNDAAKMVCINSK